MPRHSRPHHPVTDDFRIIAKDERLTIYERINRIDRGWRNFLVVSEKPMKRRSNWHLAWNGERWANGTDYAHINTNVPRLLDLILETMDA